MAKVKISHGKKHRKASITTSKGEKIIIHDMYGVFSTYKPKGDEIQAIVNCEGINLNESDARVYKVIVGEDRPWMPDWQDDYKTNLTRAEARAIIRHMNKKCKEYEERHHEMCPYYYFIYRKVYDSHMNEYHYVPWSC